MCHCSRGCSAHHCIDFATQNRCQTCNKTFKQPHITKNQSECKWSIRPNFIEKTSYRCCNLCFKWLVFHVYDCFCQFAHCCMPWWCGRMTTCTGCCKFYLSDTFFAYTNNSYRLVNTWEYSINYCAAFIQNQCWLDTIGFHIIYNTWCADTTYFFITTERQIQIVFRNITCHQQILKSFHNTQHSDFGVYCTSAPQNTINDFTTERRMLPAFFNYRNNVIVAHKNSRVFCLFAFDFKQHSGVAKFFVFCSRCNIWIHLFQFFTVGYKYLFIGFVIIRI